MNFGVADKALRDAVGDKAGLSIKGASSRGNVVQVAGLAKGTTAADVEVCLLFPNPMFLPLLPTFLLRPHSPTLLGNFQALRTHHLRRPPLQLSRPRRPSDLQA